MHLNLRFILFAGGIFFFYGLYGVFQEKLFKSTYCESDKFTYVISLLFLQTLINYVYSSIIIVTEPANSSDKTPTLYYCCCALAYLLAMASSVASLQWVSYTAQVIGKSVKPIPVLVLGVLIGNKKFPLRKYFFVTIIVFGVTLFFYKGNKTSSPIGFGIGEMLLIFSLVMDGLMNALEERIMFHYNPTSNQMMKTINGWSCVFLVLAALLTGEILKFVYFLEKYPYVLWFIGLLCFTSCIGQFFIYKTICEFGTLTCSLITTSRKFFSVLGSIIIFGNSLIPRQWFGVVCVFSGLILDSYYGESKKRPKETF